MIQDPYRVLGVSEGASQDEIKRAYRKKAKENHPDLHPGDPEASKRMNEINEAYDMLMNPEKYAQRRQQEQQAQQARQAYQQRGNPFGQTGSYGQGGYGQSGYGGPFGFDFDDMFGFGGYGRQTDTYAQPKPGDSMEVRRAVELLNQRQYQQAASVLGGVVSARRDARWHYLSALAYEGMGNLVQAMDFIRRAVQMEPNSLEYRRAMQQLQNAGQAYEQAGRGYGMNMHSMNGICTTFCLANMLCNCCLGGRGMYFCC